MVIYFNSLIQYYLLEYLNTNLSVPFISHRTDFVQIADVIILVIIPSTEVTTVSIAMMADLLQLKLR